MQYVTENTFRNGAMDTGEDASIYVRFKTL